MSQKLNIGLLIFLGILLSFGPFITDLYLVALPQMAEYFRVDITRIQLTLTFSLFGLAFGQIIFGYFGDKYGRKSPLIISLISFTFFTLLCIFSDNIYLFIFNRFMQGLFGAGCIVLARAMLPDLFSKKMLITAISLTTFIYTLNRIISPLIGGIVFTSTGWQGIFICLLLIGFMLSIYALKISETKTASKKDKTSLKKSIRYLFSNKKFIYFSLSYTAILVMQFSYIASSSFIFQKYYKVEPFVFTFLFSINAAFFGLGAFIPSKRNFTIGSYLKIASILISTCLLLTIIPEIKGNIYVYEILIIVFRIFTGMSFTLFMAQALESCRENVGLGAAFLGTFYFLLGGIITPLVGYGNIFHSSGSIMLIFSLLNFYFLLKLYHLLEKEG